MDTDAKEIVKAIQENTHEVSHFLRNIDDTLGRILQKLKGIESKKVVL
jgi:hypothetical protein